MPGIGVFLPAKALVVVVTGVQRPGDSALPQFGHPSQKRSFVFNHFIYLSFVH
jgi:hypothetical protein